MAKHDRRKASGQPRSSRTATIQVPLPVLGVLNGVREALHGLCITTGLQAAEPRSGAAPPVPAEPSPNLVSATARRREGPLYASCRARRYVREAPLAVKQARR